MIPASSAVTRERSSLIPLGRTGMWWFLASEILVFGGLVFI